MSGWLKEKLKVVGFKSAWGLLRMVPERQADQLIAVVGTAWGTRGLKHPNSGISQLRRNYARVRPELSSEALDELAVEGARRYARYYVEAFRLPSLSQQRLQASARLTGASTEVRAAVEAGEPVIMALGHLGNWDLAGAWAPSNLGHVVTIAERLKPEELFREFLDFRTGLGMTIFAHDGDGSPINATGAELERRRGTQVIAPILADRDLSARGINVSLAGHPARIAAGPAVLALKHNAPLYVAIITHEQVDGHWGIEINLRGPVTPPTEGTFGDKVAAMTQACADHLGDGIIEHTSDWHMLQKVFLADLDQDRLAAPGAS